MLLARDVVEMSRMLPFSLCAYLRSPVITCGGQWKVGVHGPHKAGAYSP
jgi:hypothetical protein